MGKYTKLDITANTVVKRGAIGVKAIYKSLDGKAIVEPRAIYKEDSKLQLHSIMYMLNVKDAHGDWVEDAKVLEDACTHFMLKGNKQVKWTHDGEETLDAIVQQLYIVPAGHPIWKEDKYIGAIANVIQFNSKEEYDKCKDGDYQTSIEGDVEEADDNDINNSEVNTVEKKKDYTGEKDTREVMDKFYVLSNAMSNILYSDKTVAEKLTEMKTSIEQFSADVGTAVVAEAPKTDEVKPDEVVEDDTKEVAKAEVPAEVTTYVESVKAEIMAELEAIKAMIPKTEVVTEEIKKSFGKDLKEIRKELALSTTDDVKVKNVKKGLLG